MSKISSFTWSFFLYSTQMIYPVHYRHIALSICYWQDKCLSFLHLIYKNNVSFK